MNSEGSICKVVLGQGVFYSSKKSFIFLYLSNLHIKSLWVIPKAFFALKSFILKKSFTFVFLKQLKFTKNTWKVSHSICKEANT